MSVFICGRRGRAARLLVRHDATHGVLLRRRLGLPELDRSEPGRFRSQHLPHSDLQLPDAAPLQLPNDHRDTDRRQPLDGGLQEVLRQPQRPRTVGPGTPWHGGPALQAVRIATPRYRRRVGHPLPPNLTERTGRTERTGAGRRAGNPRLSAADPDVRSRPMMCLVKVTTKRRKYLLSTQSVSSDCSCYQAPGRRLCNTAGFHAVIQRPDGTCGTKTPSRNASRMDYG